MSRGIKIWQAILLTGITIAPIGVILVTAQPSRVVTVVAEIPAVSTAILLWWQYLYTNVPKFRTWYIRLKSHISGRDVRISVFAEYEVPNNAVVSDVVGVIRKQYSRVPDDVKVGTLTGTGSTIVFMPGWQGRCDFHIPLEEEYFEPGDDIRRFTFAMPDTAMGLHTALHHLTATVAPLVDSFAMDLPSFKLRNIELTIRFTDGRNPYLATYLQNADSRNITSFHCKLAESADTYVDIGKESVRIVAPRVSIFTNLVREQLGLSTVFG